MYSCSICGALFLSVKAHVVHCKLHHNEPRTFFKCVDVSCKRVFSKYPAFKAHYYRHRQSLISQDLATAFLKCTVPLCECQCGDVKELVAYLKVHIVGGVLQTAQWKDAKLCSLKNLPSLLICPESTETVLLIPLVAHLIGLDLLNVLPQVLVLACLQ